jgi:hypothetical protein
MICALRTGICLLLAACASFSWAVSLNVGPNHTRRPDVAPDRSPLPSLLASAGDKLFEPDGTLSWKWLGRISIVKHENTDNRFGRGVAYFAEPVPAAEVNAQVGKRVKVRGYALPRQSGTRLGRFLVSALPAIDADGCTVGGNETFVDVEVATDAVPKLDALVTVEGTLVLFDMKNWGGYIYKLSEPRIIGGT